MKKSLVLAAVVALALPLGTAAIAAENQQTPPANHKTEKQNANVVKGTITKIEGKTLTVDGKEVKFTDKTEVIQDKKAVGTDALKVGERISARIKEGVATRIEIHAKHTGEKEHSETK